MCALCAQQQTQAQEGAGENQKGLSCTRHGPNVAAKLWSVKPARAHGCGMGCLSTVNGQAGGRL